MRYPTKPALAGLSKMLLNEGDGVDSMMKTKGKKSKSHERNDYYRSVIIVRRPET